MYEDEVEIMDVYDQLKSLGAAKAVVAFSGGGDEGGCDSIELFDAAGVKISTLNEYEDGEFVPDENSLATALCKPVYDKYYSFAGEFYVSGTVTWDVEKRRHKMSGQESVETYEGFEDDEKE